MIVGLGLDLVSVARISLLLASDDALETRVFTRTERNACAERADRAEALAARLAAKEACLKALGTGWGPGISFVQVEVLGGEGTPPRIQLSEGAGARARELGIARLHLTISHEGGFAAAVVIAERSDVSPPSD